MDLQSTQPTLCAPKSEVNPGQTLDVAVLTRRMKEGDETAYRTFYDAYYPRLWRYLLVVTAGDEEATVEALQSTLVRIVRHIKPFGDEHAFWGWLTVLARTALSDQRRSRHRYLAFLDRFTRHAQVQDSLATEPAADTKLFSLLAINLAAMPSDERALLEGKYFEGRSVRDIAHGLGTSEKAIESRLTRLRRKLKIALLERLTSERSSP